MIWEQMKTTGDVSSGKQKGRKNTIDVFALLQTFKAEKQTKNTIVADEESQSKQSKSNKRTSNIQTVSNKLNTTVNKAVAAASIHAAAETTIYQRSLSKCKSSSYVATWNKATSKTPTNNKFILVNQSNLLVADKSDFTEKKSNYNISHNPSNNGTTHRKSNTPNVSAAKHGICQSNSSSNLHKNLNNRSCSGYYSSNNTNNNNNNNRQSCNVSSFLASNYASENPHEQHKASSISIHEQQSTTHKNHFALDLSNISSSTSAAHLSNNTSSCNQQYLSVKDSSTTTNSKGIANSTSRPPQCVSQHKHTKYFETQLQTHYVSPNVFSDSIISAQNTTNPLDCSKLQQQQPLTNQRDLNSQAGQNYVQANNLQQSGQKGQTNIAKKCSSNSSSAQKNSSKGSVRSHISNEQKNRNIENKNFFEKTSPIIQQIKNERENAPPVSCYLHEFQKKKQLQRQNSYNNAGSYLQIQKYE